MKKFTLLFGLGILALGLIVFPAMAQESNTTKPATKQVVQKPAVEESKEIPAEQLKIERIACGTAVEDRELLNEADSFSPETERIYCWSLITGCEEPTTVEHVWYYGGVEKARVALEVKYPRMRTWSYKTMIPEWVGDWKVELVDTEGNVLAMTEFKVE